MTLLAATACSSGGAASGAAGAGGGTLHLATSSGPDCLDPHQSPTESSAMLSRPLLDSLVYQAPDGTLTPWLATRWQISANRLSYTFTLRPGVVFSDGEKLTAQAVIANLDQIVNPATKSLLAASLIAAYRSARALNPDTLQIQLRHPDSGFLAALATANLGIEAPATLRGKPASLCTKIVGTGPFTSPAGLLPGKGIEYTRNPGYTWAPAGAGHSGPARLDGIDIRIVPNSASRFGALTSGQVNAITALSPASARQLQDSSGFTLHQVPVPGVNYSYWPNTASGPLHDVKVRLALRYGINWAQIDNDVYFGFYAPARGVLSASTPGYNAALASSYAYQPAEAAKLLDQAGWTGRDAQGYRTKNGATLTLDHLWSNSMDPTLAVAIQAAAKQLGIRMVEQNVSLGTFVQRLLSGDYDLIDTSFAASSPAVLRVMFSTANIPTEQNGISNNISRDDNPAVQAELDSALNATSQAGEYQAYGRVQQEITATAAVLPVYSPMSTLAASSRLHGVSFNADGTPDFYPMWLAS